jgi:type II secretory pathway component PulJ
MRTHVRGQSGTTIVEIAVGLAVGAVLVAGVLTLVEQAQKTYMHSSEAADLQQNVRVAMDRLTRLIQAAGVNPWNEQWGGATANNPAFTAFREAGRNCIRVYADLNGDGNVQQADENVYFHWSTTAGAALQEQRGTLGGQPDAGTVWVAAGGAAEELARDIVANPGGADMFQYFTGPNDPLGAPNTQLVPPAASSTTCASLSDADRARVSRVVVTLTGRATVSGQTMTKTLTSDARARNVP